MVKTYIPDRRDIVWIDLNPTKGHEQSNRRPALVLSPRSYNKKTKLMVACAITSQSKGYPFEVPLASKKISGVVLSDQIRTLDWSAREITFVEKAPPQVLTEVLRRIEVLIIA